MQRLDPIGTYLAISDRERAVGGLVERRAAEAIRLSGARDGAAVLDLGAGQGWYSLALARRFDVVGVDASTSLVAEARRRATRLAGLWRPRFLVGRSEALPLPENSIDAAVSLATCIGYGSEDDDRAALEELRRVLRADGTIVLEAVSAERAARSEERERRFPDGARALYSPDFDSRTQMLSDTQAVELPDGSAGVFHYSVRAYDPPELLDLIEEAGFVCEGVYGSTDGAAPKPGDPIVVVARSRGADGCGGRSVLFDGRGQTEVSELAESLGRIPENQLLWIDRGAGEATDVERPLELDAPPARARPAPRRHHGPAPL